MELDSSVTLSVDRVVDVASELAPDAFADKVRSCVPADVKSENIGCGRILADYSVMMQTRYVLCDIYEDGTAENGDGNIRTYRYRIEIKSGKRTSRIGDAVYCCLFLLTFWFLRSWTSQGFNPLFLVLSGLLVLSALYLAWSGHRNGFGKAQADAIASCIAESSDMKVSGIR